MKRTTMGILIASGLWTSTLDAQTAADIANRPGAEAGLAVIVEPASGDLAAQLANRGRHVVAVLSADARRVRQLDDAFVSAKVHPLADAHLWHEPARLPFRDHAVNVLVLDPSTAKGISEAEVQRVIAPGYGLGLIAAAGGWKEIRKPRPKEMDVWLGWYSNGGGHMANRDLLAQPPNSVQFIGGPRSVRRLPFLATDRVLMVNQMARDAFTGVLRWMGTPNTTVEFGGGDVSDGKHLLRVQGIAGGRLPVLDLLTGQPIHGGIDLGTVHRIGPPNSREPPFAWRELCADGERVYWRGKLTSLRSAHIVKNQRLWEKEFAHPIEAIATDGKVVAVLVVEDVEKKHKGNWASYNIAVEIVALDAATGRELWRTPEVASRMILHFGLDHGVVVAATDLTGPNPDPPGNQYKGQTEVRNRLRPLNWMAAFEAATGKPVFRRTEFQDITTLGGRKSFGLLPGRIVVMSDEDYVTQFDMKTGATIGGRSLPTNAGGVDGMRAYRAQHYSMTPNWLIHQALGGIDWAGEPSVHRHSPKLQTVWYDSRVFPANGMLYYPPRIASTHADGGLNPAPAMIVRNAPPPVPDSRRLLVAGRADGVAAPAPADWPTLRGTPERTAWAPSHGPAAAKLAWEARLPFAPVPESAQLIERGWRFNSTVPGPITQPVADGKRVLVAVPDAHRLDCLRLTDGKPLWSTRLGGRITSPPTLAGEVAYVGCNDGTINAIGLADGRVIWSFLAARNGDLVMAFEQVENLGIVPSTPVIRGDTVYVTAGRHSLMEDGIALYALDAATGAVRRQRMLDLAVFHAQTAGTPQSVDPSQTHKSEAIYAHHGSSPLQLVGDRLRYGPWVIEPETLEVQREDRGIPGRAGQRAVPSGFDRRAPVPWRGDHAGGMGWIKPVDQWGGYKHPLPRAGSGPDSGFSVLAIRADGLAVVGDNAKKSADLEVIPLEGEPSAIGANLTRFHALHAMAGAGDRVYLAGSEGRTLLLSTVDVTTGESVSVEVPAVVPSALNLLTDGMPYSTATHTHPSAAKVADHEYVIPDGIAVAHGHVILTTTAGRVLVFK